MRFEQMFRLLPFRIPILVSGLVIFCASTWAQINLVHVTSCPAPAKSCVIPSTGSGNLLVIAWGSEPGGGATTITGVADNAGNTFSAISGSRAVDFNKNDMGEVWYAKNSLAGGTSLTIASNPVDASGTAVIWEFSGVDTSEPLDQTAVVNSQEATTTPRAAPLTTTVPNELILAVGWIEGTVNGVLEGGHLARRPPTRGHGWAHYVATSYGTYGAQWSSSLGTYSASTVSFKGAASGGGPCDLNSDGAVNVVDVQLAVNMDLGLLACPLSVNGGVCNSTLVNEILNSALGQGCSATISHSVSLTWAASSSPNIAGYNVYRSGTSGGPYAKLNSSLVSGISLTDNSVLAGQTYYYVATAVDTSNNESAYSAQAQAKIPTP
jgi:hypothetical protein